MAKRPAIPRFDEKALYQEVSSRCPLCGEDNTKALTIHHIIPFEEVKKHDLQAMIVLCANCHARADKGEISREELLRIKRKLRKIVSINRTPFEKAGFGRPPQVNAFIAAGRDVNVAGDIVIKSGRARKPAAGASIPGTVAEDKWKVGYLKYLGHRFNQFKEWEMKIHQQKMSYAVVWTQYRRHMRFTVEQTPLELFGQAIVFFTSKIDNTMIGRIRQARGKTNYRDYQGFVSLGKDHIDLDTGNA